MTDKQIWASMDFLAGWLDKASVGCLLVGMFQTDHMFGGFIGSMVCFLHGRLKFWSQDEFYRCDDTGYKHGLRSILHWSLFKIT